MRNMKGETCPFDNRVCQEGWCENCTVYLEYEKNLIEGVKKKKK